MHFKCWDRDWIDNWIDGGGKWSALICRSLSNAIVLE
jgi:hypothetical protein